jgi:hypothetical protein
MSSRGIVLVVAVAVAVAALSLLADRAGAATLASGYLTNGGSYDTFTCTVVSTKPKPVPDVTFELVRANGTAIVSFPGIALNPDDPRTIFWETGEPGAYCRVVGKISKQRTRLTLCNGTGTGLTCAATVNVP